MEEVLAVDTSECFAMHFNDNMELINTAADSLELDFIDKLHVRPDSEYLLQTYQSLGQFCLSSEVCGPVGPKNTASSKTAEDVKFKLSSIADKIKVLTKQLADVTHKRLKFLDLIKKLSNDIRRLKLKIKEEVRRTKQLNKALKENVSENVCPSAVEPGNSVSLLCKELAITGHQASNVTRMQDPASGQMTFEVLTLPSTPLVLYIQPLEQPKIIGPSMESTQKPLRRLLKNDINRAEVQKYCAIAPRTALQQDNCASSNSIGDVVKQKDYKENRETKAVFKCSKCPKKFIQLENLRRHLLVHSADVPEGTGNDYHCDKCDKSFTRNDALRRHEHQHGACRTTSQTERKGNESDFRCEKCEKRFVRRYALTRHERLHNGDFRHLCSICGKGFVDAIYLRQHVEGHTRQHSCDVCGKCFSRSKDLTVHLRQHTGEAPYKCTLCTSSFKSYNGLRYHAATHSNAKVHVCPVCGRKFSCTGNLRSHMNSHNKEKKTFVCAECGITFSNRYRLKIHTMQVHPAVGDVSLRCTLCEKQFVDLGNLKSHLCSYSVGAPYACNLCCEKYRKVQDLSAHMSMIHKHSLRECAALDQIGNIFQHLQTMPILQ